MESALKCCVVQGTNMDKTVFDPRDHLKKIQTYPGTIGSTDTTQEVKILTEKPDPYDVNDRDDEDGSQVFEENRGAVVLNPCVSGQSSRFDLSDFIRDLEHRQDVHEREQNHPEHNNEAMCYQQVSTNTRKMYSYTNHETASDDGRLNPQVSTEGGDNALCEKCGNFTKNATGHPQMDCAANKVNTMYRDHAVTDRTLAKGVDDVTGLGHKATQHSTHIPDVNAENEETRETCGTLDDTNEMFRAEGQYSLLKHALNHEKETFICLFCEQAFDMQYHFKKNILLLRGEKPKVCKACKRVSEEVSDLQRVSTVQSKTCEFVEMTHRVEEPYQSETYSGLLTDNIIPNSHISIQSKEILKEKAVSNGRTKGNEQESENCKESLTVMSSDNDHIHMQAVERLSGSKGCQESFVSHADVQKVFECKVCHKLLTYKSAVKRHYRVHTEERPFECTECHKSFRWKSDLMDHVRIHKGEKPFQCTECHKSFRQKSTLTVHIRIHTEEKPFKCKECQKSFSEKITLDRNALMHTDEKAYQCEYCEKTFRRMNTLKNHARIHTGEKPYECKQCGKYFRHNAHLKTHARIHTGEKPFKCKQCGKSFRQNITLKRHARIHVGEKPFKCKQCGKSFRQNVTLKRHARIHTAEKPFKCKQCGKSFSRTDTLNEHSRTHTEEKPYQCKSCSKSFKHRSTFNRHARIHETKRP